jgi:phosphoglycolate phosphatase-like HAD superfamily hydrolase
MWGGWARELGAGLEAAVRRPVSPDVFAAIGFDPVTGHVQPRAPLAIATMDEIASTVEAVMRRWCPSPVAARRAVDAAWTIPDPVALAVPLADLATLVTQQRAAGRRLAVITTDDRAPTDATLRHLGVRDAFGALVCGDDGFATKPEPDAVWAVCQAYGVPPARVAVVGDSPADMAMGRSAGAGLVVGVRSGLGDDADLAEADLVIDAIADLLESPREPSRR